MRKNGEPVDQVTIWAACEANIVNLRVHYSNGQSKLHQFFEKDSAPTVHMSYDPDSGNFNSVRDKNWKPQVNSEQQ